MRGGAMNLILAGSLAGSSRNLPTPTPNSASTAISLQKLDWQTRPPTAVYEP